MIDARYNSIAIILHWLTAIAVLVLICTGLYMVNGDLSRADQFRLYQWHKAGGVVVLNLVIIRLLVRLLCKPPRLPSQLSERHKRLANIGHLALYALMLTIPLSGWLMVSASPFGLPTFVFVDWLKWPHIPLVERNKTAESIANYMHMLLAYSSVLIVTGHIIAVGYHKKVHQLNLLSRMWWGKKK